MEVNIPISLGELIDKITILQIKRENVKDDSKLNNINKEFESLNKILISLELDENKFTPLYEELYKTNLKLWNIEDDSSAKFMSGVYELVEEKGMGGIGPGKGMGFAPFDPKEMGELRWGSPEIEGPENGDGDLKPPPLSFSMAMLSNVLFNKSAAIKTSPINGPLPSNLIIGFLVDRTLYRPFIISISMFFGIGG